MSGKKKIGQIHRGDVKIFHWICGSFDLLVVLYEMSGDHQSQKDSSSGDH